METIQRFESNVRSYSRSFPTVFTHARGEHLFDRDGKKYLDFFAGAGALNYGHNHPDLKARLIEHISNDGVTHGLDMATDAKLRFLEALHTRVLEPRGLSYRTMFPGPTGTNAVEAAVKLARKATGRLDVVAFTNAFHGMTIGALALTGNAMKRGGAGMPLMHTLRAPFDGFLGDGVDTLDTVERMLDDSSSGWNPPAAFIVETVQGEGGVNVASDTWLQRLERLARKHDALLIVDDIQVGCGRTGPFFSFEPSGIRPDIVCLSKSLSGYGLPFAVTMFREDLDLWAPGEHNGTFRGNNHAFVTASAALELFWGDDALTRDVEAKSRRVRDRLAAVAEQTGGHVRGRGLIQALVYEDADVAEATAKGCFDRGLVIETAGTRDEALKLLPPLTIPSESLEQGLDIIEESAKAARAANPSASQGNPKPAHPSVSA